MATLLSLYLLYAAAGLLTGGFLVTRGYRMVRRWVVENRPRTAEDWVFAPILGCVALVLIFLVLSVGAAAWPVTLFILHSERERRLAGLQKEEEELLMEVRRSAPPPP